MMHRAWMDGVVLFGRGLFLWGMRRKVWLKMRAGEGGRVIITGSYLERVCIMPCVCLVISEHEGE